MHDSRAIFGNLIGRLQDLLCLSGPARIWVPLVSIRKYMSKQPDGIDGGREDRSNSGGLRAMYIVQ